MRHMKRWGMAVTPDILLVPSKITPFVKEVMGVVVINGGTLAKGNTGGTFANILIHPMHREVLDKAEEGGSEVEHKVAERAMVQVVRI